MQLAKTNNLSFASKPVFNSKDYNAEALTPELAIGKELLQAASIGYKQHPNEFGYPFDGRKEDCSNKGEQLRKMAEDDSFSALSAKETIGRVILKQSNEYNKFNTNKPPAK